VNGMLSDLQGAGRPTACCRRPWNHAVDRIASHAPADSDTALSAQCVRGFGIGYLAMTAFLMQ